MKATSELVIHPLHPTSAGPSVRRILLATAMLAAAVPPVVWPAEVPGRPQPAPPEAGTATADVPAAATDSPAATADGSTTEAAYHFARGKLLADNGAFEQALTAFRRALELDRSDPYSLVEVSEFHAYLAQISQGEQKRLANLQAAAEYAEQARELAPENLDVLRAYGQIHMRLVEQRQLESLALAGDAFEALRQRTEGDLQVLMALGQLYLWQGESAKAAEVLEEAAGYRPGHPAIEAMLVDSLLGAGEKRRAEELLERAVERDPSSLDDRLRLVELVSERGDHRRAVEILKSSPESLFPSFQLRQALARELHLSGDNKEALAVADTLLEESPAGTGPGVRRLRVAILSALTRYDEAISELEPLVSGGDEVEELRDTLLMSRLLERVGRPDEAAERLRGLAAGASGPHAVRAKVALLTLLERQGLGDEAVDFLRRELAAVPAGEAGRLSPILSQLLVRLDRPAEALEVIGRALARTSPEDREVRVRLRVQRLTILAREEVWPRVIDLAPELIAAEAPEVRAAGYLFLSQALAATDRVDEALEQLREGGEELGSPGLLARQIELLFANDRAAEAQRLLDERTAGNDAGDLLFAAQVHQRAERYRDAIPLLGRLLDQDPTSLPARFLLGSSYERSGQRQRAVESFQQLLELSPDHTPTLNYLGYMWAEQGENLDQALELLKRAVALEPDNGAYVDSLGWAYFQLGRYDEARRHLEWAARLIPDDPTILEHLGDLYVVFQDLERARDSYQQALDLGGDSVDEVRRKLASLDGKGL